MKKIVRYSITLSVENSSYGLIRLYFESSENEYYDLPSLTLPKFKALCFALETRQVYYDPVEKVFFTPLEELEEPTALT